MTVRRLADAYCRTRPWATRGSRQPRPGVTAGLPLAVELAARNCPIKWPVLRAVTPGRQGIRNIYFARVSTHRASASGGGNDKRGRLWVLQMADRSIIAAAVECARRTGGGSSSDCVWSKQGSFERAEGEQTPRPCRMRPAVAVVLYRFGVAAGLEGEICSHRARG